MVQAVQARDVVLDGTRTAIIVPVISPDPDDLRAHSARARESSSVDLLEWRVDALFDAASDAHDDDGSAAERVATCARAVRAGAADLPVLATVRSAQEGGPVALTAAQRVDAHELLLGTGAADLLDVEVLADAGAARASIDAAHDHGVPVVGSHHRFDATPSVRDMVDALMRIRSHGADLVKLAVMPRSAHDVVALLEATVEARAQLDVPLIMIAMGPLGLLSRCSGAVFGQAATFASLGAESAPGQLDATEMAHVLRVLGARP